MAADERYDFVIVGGGPNGVTLAAYLAKSGASVCVLEERTEAGGACENTEPIPGVKINPHAIMLYGAAAPGFDQLELWKYGWRIGENEMGDLMGPGSSAIIAVVEHKWVGDLVAALEEQGAQIMRQELKDEVARSIALGAGEEGA